MSTARLSRSAREYKTTLGRAPICFVHRVMHCHGGSKGPESRCPAQAAEHQPVCALSRNLPGRAAERVRRWAGGWVGPPTSLGPGSHMSSPGMLAARLDRARLFRGAGTGFAAGSSPRSWLGGEGCPLRAAPPVVGMGAVSLITRSNRGPSLRGSRPAAFGEGGDLTACTPSWRPPPRAPGSGSSPCCPRACGRPPSLPRLIWGRGSRRPSPLVRGSTGLTSGDSRNRLALEAGAGAGVLPRPCFPPPPSGLVGAPPRVPEGHPRCTC